MDVDTRLLRYFVAVADRRSFTQAARDLYIAQPSLSRQVKQLEARLGVDLFTRPDVRLTPAGEELLPAARRLLADLRDTTRRVRATAAAADTVLRVGFVVAGGGPLARQARAEFGARHPHATVEPKRVEWGGEARALREGQVDVALVWLPADLSGLHSEPVATEARWVAVGTRHRLAGRQAVGIADLRDEPLVWTRVASAEWVDWWAVNPRPDGSTPVWGPENDNADEMLEHVAAGTAVCIAPESMAEYYRHPDLTWLPITDVAPLRIALAWPVEQLNPLVAEFVRVVRALTRAAGGGGEPHPYPEVLTP